jgi:hypothetical protein
MSLDEPIRSSASGASPTAVQRRLTAFDAALLRTLRARNPGSCDAAPAAVPGGWRAAACASFTVARTLVRTSARDQRRHGRAIEALVNRDHERAVAFEQFQSALITFLQQITAFIDTKDRQLSAVAAGRIDEQQKTLAVLQQRLDDTLPSCARRSSCSSARWRC